MEALAQVLARQRSVSLSAAISLPTPDERVAELTTAHFGVSET